MSYVEGQLLNTAPVYYPTSIIGDSLGLQEYHLQADAHGTMTSWAFALIAMMIGLMIQSTVHNELGPFPISLALFLLGLIPLCVPFWADRWSRRAYVLTYGVTTLMAGIYQLYQINVMKEFLFSDEGTFYSWVSMGLEGKLTWRHENYWLPVVIWRFFYSVADAMRHGNASWIGTIPNTLIMALSASILSRAARHIFGPDDYRLRKLGTLFAVSGIFWMYGACFLRDCYALIVQVIIIWAILRFLRTSNIRNLIIAAIAIALCYAAMRGIRGRTLPMFFAFIMLAGIAWTRREGMSIGVLLLVIVGLPIAVVTAQYFMPYFGMAMEDVLGAAEIRGYGFRGMDTTSLTRQLVMNQPLPLRVILGSLLLLIYPIPIWTHFQIGHPFYLWFKGFQGVLNVAVILPLVFVAIGRCFRIAIKGGADAAISLFLLAYAGLTMAAVAASAIETRYWGQFLPVLLLLAVIPDWRNIETRSKVIHIGVVWFICILMGHLMWAVMKAG